MKFVNLTSHSLDLLTLGITIEPSNRTVKVTQNHKLIKEVSGIPIYEIEYVSASGIPEPEEDTIFIVSAPVLNYVCKVMPERKDFVSPFKAIKNGVGKTVGCSAFRINN